jgi:hypothetical protein
MEAVVEVPGGANPDDEYVVGGYRDGKEVSLQTVKFIDEHLSQISDQTVRYRFGRVALESWPSEVALWVKSEAQKEWTKVAQADVNPPNFEAEAVARPDKIINPVDLCAILPPADWLVLAGGQKAEVEVAALSRSGDLSGALVNVWYESTPHQKVKENLDLSDNHKARVKLGLGACSETLKQDTLDVAIVDGAGKEVWRKNIHVMIVPDPPKWPGFGAVETKLRYDAPIPMPGGQTMPYENGWDPKFQDVVVCFPNGARFVFWRGSSDIPFWAGRDNTGFSYEWAERGSPPPWGEPLMDHELRYARVEILESTASRVHIRWSYQSVGVNYVVSGDFAVEDFYFYPDGFGTRVMTLTCTPQAGYELNEFIPLTPQSGYPLAMLPAHMLDYLWIGGGKAEFNFPYFEGEQTVECDKVKTKRKDKEIPIYRVWIDRSEQSAIQYSPWGEGPTFPGDFVPQLFGPQFDRGAVVTRGYWGNHWPLSREGGAGLSAKNRLHISPAHNSFISTGLTATEDNPHPTPIRRERLWMRDGLGHLNPMRRDTFVYLVGMTAASDDDLRHWAQSFTQPPEIQVQGAELDADSYYAQDRRALCMTMQGVHKPVEITLTPAGWTVNPVFEIKNAPKTLRGVRLNNQVLDAGQYRWDGSTLWLSANLSQPTALQLDFGGE